MRKHTFLRAKNFLLSRAENAVFAGSFRQGRRDFPVPTARNSARLPYVSRACFTAEKRLGKAGGKGRFSRGFRANFARFSSLLYIEMIRRAERRIRGAFATPVCRFAAKVRTGVSALPKLPRGGNAFPHRRKAPLPSMATGNSDGRQRQVQHARAVCAAPLCVLCAPLVVVCLRDTRCRGCGNVSHETFGCSTAARFRFAAVQCFM